jgi:hypothetical protein
MERTEWLHNEMNIDGYRWKYMDIDGYRWMMMMMVMTS